MKPTPASPSFALICVLALVSLAALSTTAFLANARLERLSARTIGDQTRLDLGLTFGANLTLGQMSKLDSAWNWITFVRREDSNGTGYLFLGIPYAGANAANLNRWTCFPLFSPATITSIDSTNPIPASQLAFTIVNQASFAETNSSNGLNPAMVFTGNTVRIPLLGFRTSPAVGWITNRSLNAQGSNVPTIRFAYFTEDMEGLFQADRMGGTTNRTTGTNGEEISLLAMGTNANAAAMVADFVSSRAAYLTPGTIAAVLSNSANLEPLLTNAQYFAAGTRTMNGNHSNVVNDSRSLNYVPAGMGYAAAYANPNGTNKMNLNNYLNTSSQASIGSNVTAISGWIGSNLTNFAAIRAGGFTNSGGGGATNANAYTTNAYLQTLAANIIDYADADSTPSTDGTAISTNRDRPIYRGVDSCPYINEINKRYLLTSTAPMTISGINGLAYIVETTDYLELWNPSSQSTQPGTLKFLAVHGQPATLGFSNISFDKPLWASNSLGPISNGITSNSLTVPVIPPNGFTTLACPTTTNLFFYGATNNPPVFTLTQEFTNSRYFVAWDGVYYDAAMGGIRRNSGNLTLNSPANRGNLPSFIYATSGGNFADPAVGDPRATIYLSQVLDFNAYVGNATFGGRNVRAGTVASTKEYYEVTPAGWPDGGHNSPKGSSPTSDNQLPTSFASMNTNLSPGRISNFGSFTNICELGGVFDPIQWADPSLGVWEGKWTNLSVSGISTNAFGGGTSLRIGRAESGKFAWTNVTVGGSPVPMPNMQASAAALLDLFCTSPNYDDGGKINLNTAPPAVLRALATGILLTNDPAILPASMRTSVVPVAAVNAFVKGVTNFRAQYPFLSASQLGFVWTNAGLPNTNTWPRDAVFGNTNVVLATEWNDAAAEEWFGKIYGLSKASSRNWRVYCVAQLLNTNGQPKGGIVRRYFELTARQNNNANPTISGFISGQAPY